MVAPAAALAVAGPTGLGVDENARLRNSYLHSYLIYTSIGLASCVVPARPRKIAPTDIRVGDLIRHKDDPTQITVTRIVVKDDYIHFYGSRTDGDAYAAHRKRASKKDFILLNPPLASEE